MKALSLLAEGDLFAVDVTIVQKVIRNIAYTTVPSLPYAVAGIASMKGGIVTVISLAELLGYKRSDKAVHAIVFKFLANSSDQMGLLIDMPGDLIDIDENEIHPPVLAAGEEEKNYISGIVELEGKLYRIINVESIIKRFRDSGESGFDKKQVLREGNNNG